jgi:hypothetical protein
MSRAGLLIPKASRPDHPSRPVRCAELLDTNHSLGARRVNELVAAKGQAHVRSTWRNRGKEHEVAEFEFIEADEVADVELGLHVSRQRDTVLGEDILNEPATVEAGRIASTVKVWRSAKGQSSVRHGKRVDPVIRRSGRRVFWLVAFGRQDGSRARRGKRTWHSPGRCAGGRNSGSGHGGAGAQPPQLRASIRVRPFRR